MGLHTLWAKTMIQNTGHGPPLPLVTILAQTVNVTEKFKYLGSDVDYTDYSSPDTPVAWVLPHQSWASWSVCGEIRD